MAAARLRVGGSPSGAGPLDPPAQGVLGDPLAFFAADHARQRAACAHLKLAARDGQIGRAEADPLIAFLSYDLPLHHDDLAQDFFPMLRRRITPEDALVPVLARLAEDHRRAETQAQAIVDLLSVDERGDPIRLGPAACDLILAYAAQTHRLVSLESGIVLAIARVRLTRGDLKMLGSALKARRGIGAP